MLVIATSNEHKVEEISSWLAALVGRALSVRGAATLPQGPAPEETGETFLENASIKARACAARASMLPPDERPDWVVADDSGLEVDALDGAPGVRTRRFAGPNATDTDNNSRLLAALEGLPPERRGARYVCVLALALPGAGARPRAAVRMRVVRGTTRGRIATGPRGTGGFGYDPIFEPEGEPPGGRTFGLWSAEAKNAISHRGRAARRMTPILRELGF